VPLGAYFIDIVRDALEDRFGEELYRSRLRIHTTLDPVRSGGGEGAGGAAQVAGRPGAQAARASCRAPWS
jgi:hypothetical protein